MMIIRHMLPLASACGLLAVAGCAANPTTPTPPPAPVAIVAPPPAFDMGPPSGTFVYLPNAGVGYEGTSTGNSGGTGTLFYKGKRYTFTAAGVSAGRMGESPGPVSGEVYGLNNLRDINGTYTADMMTGGREAVLKNKEGVTLHMMARSGIQMAVNTATVRLNYR